MRYSSSLVGASAIVVAAPSLRLFWPCRSSPRLRRRRRPLKKNGSSRPATGKVMPAGRTSSNFAAALLPTTAILYVLYGRVNARDQIIASRIAGLASGGRRRRLLQLQSVQLDGRPSRAGAVRDRCERRRSRREIRHRALPRLADARSIQRRSTPISVSFRRTIRPGMRCSTTASSFGRSIAEHMGLKLPAFVWLEPQGFRRRSCAK